LVGESGFPDEEDRGRADRVDRRRPRPRRPRRRIEHRDPAPRCADASALAGAVPRRAARGDARDAAGGRVRRAARRIGRLRRGLGALYGSSSVTESIGDKTTYSFTCLLAAPRVGYALNLATDITLWARGGISVVYSKVEAVGSYARQPTTSRPVAATIELPIVFTVLPRLALTAGPTLDITFRGRVAWPSDSYDEHVTELGIQGGVLIHL
jgi:hypothetical protein